MPASSERRRSRGRGGRAHGSVRAPLLPLPQRPGHQHDKTEGSRVVHEGPLLCHPLHRRRASYCSSASSGPSRFARRKAVLVASPCARRCAFRRAYTAMYDWAGRAGMGASKGSHHSLPSHGVCDCPPALLGPWDHPPSEWNAGRSSSRYGKPDPLLCPAATTSISTHLRLRKTRFEERVASRQAGSSWARVCHKSQIQSIMEATRTPAE